MKTPVTKDRLRQHWNYSWWKYVLLVMLAVIGWNLIYTMTAYRPPAEKKVDLYISGTTGDQTLLNGYLENVRATEMADMEQMTSVVLAADDYYGSIQLSTYIAAGEGDVYLMDASTFQQYAANGGMLALEDNEALLAAAEAAGISVDKGWRTETETGERHLYGIPASSLTGFHEYGVIVQDTYLCVLVNCGNNDNAVKLVSILLRDMQSAEAPATATDLATPVDLATPTDAQ